MYAVLWFTPTIQYMTEQYIESSSMYSFYVILIIIVHLRTYCLHTHPAASTFSTLWKGPSQVKVRVSFGRMQASNGSPVIVHSRILPSDKIDNVLKGTMTVINRITLSQSDRGNDEKDGSFHVGCWLETECFGLQCQPITLFLHQTGFILNVVYFDSWMVLCKNVI